ncbi:MAG: hypothetical protein RLZZ46_148 [Bacteroidota bacterium]|jgi:hypothetical protein
MLRLFFFTLICIFLSSCSQDNAADRKFGKPLPTDLVKDGFTSEKLPEITFKSLEYSFGSIKEGAVVKTGFSFTNTGKTDLIIGDAKGSCGCTVPKFPTEPIKPGQGGVIEVEFNSAGKQGSQRKTITVITNAEPSTRVLAIKGEVKPRNSD